jgi:(S)-citramalyl-CoA lyase
MKKTDFVLPEERPARSWLFTPATKTEHFAKAREVGADIQILDLEDSVPPMQKETASKNAFGYLEAHSADGPLLALRVNTMRTQWGLRDLDALMQSEAEPDFVVIPKVTSANDVRLVAGLLEECGKSIGIVAMIESARAIARLEEIAESDARLSFLLF